MSKGVLRASSSSSNSRSCEDGKWSSGVGMLASSDVWWGERESGALGGSFVGGGWWWVIMR